jgi:hypothetical protein
MWPTQKRENENLYYFEQYKSKHYSVICTFSRFHLGNIYSYFCAKTYMSNQDNMFMQNIILII